MRKVFSNFNGEKCKNLFDMRLIYAIIVLSKSERKSEYAKNSYAVLYFAQAF